MSDTQTNTKAGNIVLLPNPKTRNQTLALIHESYQKALSKSYDILDIVGNFYNELLKQISNVPDTDKNFFYKFMAGVKNCLHERERTFKVTNLITTRLNLLTCYIIIWLNTTPKCVLASMSEGTFTPDFKFNYDVLVLFRRKALESELFKILKRALRNDHIMRNRKHYTDTTELSSSIRDRWGALLVVNNDLSRDDELKYIDCLSNCIINILCEQNLEVRSEFISWLEANADEVDVFICKKLLNLSFSIGHFKDYARKPKGSYETQQFTITVDHASEQYGGLQFEVQIRTKRMHKNAVESDSDASHTKHKQDFSAPEFAGLDIDKLTKVIYVDDFNTISIPGFTGYVTEHVCSSDDILDLHEVTNEEDIDGIYLPKIICRRRVSPKLARVRLD